jgi:hypothetical protein
MKYIINRHGGYKTETTKRHVPVDAVVEYTGQVPESDLPFTTITTVDDTEPAPKQAVDVNGDPVFETLQTPSLDINGDPILDINGNPVLIDYQSPVIELDVNGDQVMEDIVIGNHKVFTVDTVARDLAISTKATADAHQASIEAKKQRREFGGRIKDEIAVINDGKGLTVPQTIALMSDPIIQAVDGLLSAGSIDSARATIVGSDLSAYYTAGDITYITDLIDAFLA